MVLQGGATLQIDESVPDTGLTVTEVPEADAAAADAHAGAMQKMVSTDAHKSHA